RAAVPPGPTPLVRSGLTHALDPGVTDQELPWFTHLLEGRVVQQRAASRGRSDGYRRRLVVVQIRHLQLGAGGELAAGCRWCAALAGEGDRRAGADDVARRGLGTLRGLVPLRSLAAWRGLWILRGGLRILRWLRPLGG